MFRVAGPLVALCCLASPAAAADLGYGGHAGRRSVDAVGVKCHNPVIETVRYKEQVCERGVSGYAYCRWINREHDVRVPEICTPAYTSESVTPATRGAFPPYPHGQ